MKEKTKNIKKYTATSLGYLGLVPPLIALSASLVHSISSEEAFEFNLLYATLGVWRERDEMHIVRGAMPFLQTVANPAEVRAALAGSRHEWMLT